MIGEAEVIIGAEVKDFAAILQPNARALSGVDETLLLKKAASADVVEALGEDAFEGAVHGR
jgi:hypothetical protein